MVLSRLLHLHLRPKHPHLPHALTRLLLSTSSALSHDLPPPPTSPKPTLSARMSFVFDQIDAIRQDRTEKDGALERIRAWRHSKQQQQQKGVAEEAVDGMEGVGEVMRKEVELVHPWPEWIELMERLLQQNYFDHRRVDEDKVAENFPGVDLDGFADGEFVGAEFWRDWASVCTACKNFGHDRFDILKSLSRKDIQVLVGYGCPSMDGKVVYSSKLLRKYAHVDEGDVCSACSLRSSCKKGFLPVSKEDQARTLDVIRVLLTFGFDSINGSVKNKPLMKMKAVKTVVRKLLHEIVKLSAIPIDPNLPRPVIKRPPPKVKQTPPPPKKRVGRDDIEMKKGDWLCSKCDFMNFAKNAICLQCDAKRPKRELLPGEWECPKCNFLNYRRNMACFHCECKRPSDEYTDNQVPTRQQEPRTRSSDNFRMPNVSDAWNFDFDENESDGADVAAFEFADPPRMGDNVCLNDSMHRETSRKFSDDFDGQANMPTNRERKTYFSESDEKVVNCRGRGTGFDDFDDEEYNVDGYEIDMPHDRKTPAVSRRNLSEFENSSESEDFDNHNQGFTSKSSSNDSIIDSDSEVDIADHPKWKTSRYKGVSYGSDDDDDDVDDDDDDGGGGGDDAADDDDHNDYGENLKKRHGGLLNESARRDVSFNKRSSRRSKDDDTWVSRGAHRSDRGFEISGGHKQNNRDDLEGYERPLRGVDSGRDRRKNEKNPTMDRSKGKSWSSGRSKFDDESYAQRRSNRRGDSWASDRSKFDDRPHTHQGNNRRVDSWASDRPSRNRDFEHNQIRSNKRNDRSKFEGNHRRGDSWVNDRSRIEGSSRRGDSWVADRPRRQKEFENNHTGSNKHNDESKFDNRPRRRIIER